MDVPRCDFVSINRLDSACCDSVNVFNMFVHLRVLDGPFGDEIGGDEGEDGGE